MTFTSTNPTTGQVIATFPTLPSDAVEDRIAKSASASPRWRLTTHGDRAKVLREAARLLDADAKRYAALMSREMGKPFAEGVAEVNKCARVCRYYAERASGMLADEPHDSDASKAWVRYEPLGPILGIMPWNFPFWQVFRFAAPAIAAGNTVLVKHAPNVPQCAEVIEALWRRAGARDGVYQDLRVAVAQVEAVIADPRVRGVSLTGSTGAGRAVAAVAGRSLKPTVVELGGSDAFIVMPSANLDAAIDTAVVARTLNNGQSCIAAKRFIVHEQVYEAFTESFVAKMSALEVGDPMDEGVRVGPLVSASALEQLQRQVDETVQAGARALTGARALGGRGFFYSPTVLVDVPKGTPAHAEELFGPVASVWSVPDLDAAIALANETDYGLGASVWTEDDDEMAACVEQLDVGAVFFNGLVKSDPRLPFGGIKGSGYGRELGRHGLLSFTNAKTVWRA